MADKNKKESKNKIMRNDIFIGTVSLIKTDDGDDGKSVRIDPNSGRKIRVIDIRKIVFENNFGSYGKTGRDIVYSLSRKNPYCYSIVKDEEIFDCLNNTVVIRDAHSMQALLGYAGYEPSISRSHVGGIKNLLLSPDETINIKKHTEKLNEYGQGIMILNIHRDEIQEQAKILYKFKERKLPSKPTDLEKTYGLFLQLQK